MYIWQESFVRAINAYVRAIVCVGETRTQKRCPCQSHLNLSSTVARISFLICLKLQPSSCKDESKSSINPCGEESWIHFASDAFLQRWIAEKSFWLCIYMRVCVSEKERKKDREWNREIVFVCVWRKTCTFKFVYLCVCVCMRIYVRLFVCTFVCNHVSVRA